MKVRLPFLIACLLGLLLPACCLHAQKPQPTDSGHDSIRVSLLTCAAGEEIYSLFGHTAIRYENCTRGIDVVFNYGIFNFNAPNFVLRFALGETDYQLGATDYLYFADEYRYDGRDVWQQELNLKQKEKERLMALLRENYRPENRVYRYNFFYDNCATRPRDLIEKAISGQVVYADDMTDTQTGITFRDLLRKYSEGHPWCRFGMDLCMGPEADRPISRRVQMFVPFYLQEAFRHAGIEDRAGDRRPLVWRERKIVEADKIVSKGFLDIATPLRMACLLLAAVAGSTAYGIRKQKSLWGLDVCLLASAGLAGCLLAFLALFSQHPAVSPNYLLFVFHPFHLLCLPFVMGSIRKRRVSLYMAANAAVLTLFMALWPIIPQNFAPAVLPLALCLWVRSCGNLLTAYKRHRIEQSLQ